MGKYQRLGEYLTEQQRDCCTLPVHQDRRGHRWLVAAERQELPCVVGERRDPPASAELDAGRLELGRTSRLWQGAGPVRQDRAPASPDADRRRTARGNRAQPGRSRGGGTQATSAAKRRTPRTGTANAPDARGPPKSIRVARGGRPHPSHGARSADGQRVVAARGPR